MSSQAKTPTRAAGAAGGGGSPNASKAPLVNNFTSRVACTGSSACITPVVTVPAPCTIFTDAEPPMAEVADIALGGYLVGGATPAPNAPLCPQCRMLKSEDGGESSLVGCDCGCAVRTALLSEALETAEAQHPKGTLLLPLPIPTPLPSADACEGRLNSHQPPAADAESSSALLLCAALPPQAVRVGDLVRHADSGCRGVVRYIGPMYRRRVVATTNTDTNTTTACGIAEATPPSSPPPPSSSHVGIGGGQSHGAGGNVSRTPPRLLRGSGRAGGAASENAAASDAHPPTPVAVAAAAVSIAAAAAAAAASGAPPSSCPQQQISPPPAAANFTFSVVAGPPSSSSSANVTASNSAASAAAAAQPWFGVEWERPIGRNNGVVDGIHYFTPITYAAGRQQRAEHFDRFTTSVGGTPPPPPLGSDGASPPALASSPPPPPSAASSSSSQFYCSMVRRGKMLVQKSLLRALHSRYSSGGLVVSGSGSGSDEGGASHATVPPPFAVVLPHHQEGTSEATGVSPSIVVCCGEPTVRARGGDATNEEGNGEKGDPNQKQQQQQKELPFSARPRTSGLDPFARAPDGSFPNVHYCDCTANASLKCVGFAELLPASVAVSSSPAVATFDEDKCSRPLLDAALAPHRGCYTLAFLFPNLHSLSLTGTLLQAWAELWGVLSGLPSLTRLDAGSVLLSEPMTIREMQRIYETEGVRRRPRGEHQKQFHQHQHSDEEDTVVANVAAESSSAVSLLPPLAYLNLSDTNLSSEAFLFVLAMFPTLREIVVGNNTPAPLAKGLRRRAWAAWDGAATTSKTDKNAVHLPASSRPLSPAPAACNKSAGLSASHATATAAADGRKHSAVDNDSFLFLAEESPSFSAFFGGQGGLQPPPFLLPTAADNNEASTTGHGTRDTSELNCTATDDTSSSSSAASPSHTSLPAFSSNDGSPPHHRASVGGGDSSQRGASSRPHPQLLSLLCPARLREAAVALVISAGAEEGNGDGQNPPSPRYAQLLIDAVSTLLFSIDTLSVNKLDVGGRRDARKMAMRRCHRHHNPQKHADGGGIGPFGASPPPPSSRSLPSSSQQAEEGRGYDECTNTYMCEAEEEPFDTTLTPLLQAVQTLAKLADSLAPFRRPAAVTAAAASTASSHTSPPLLLAAPALRHLHVSQCPISSLSYERIGTFAIDGAGWVAPPWQVKPTVAAHETVPQPSSDDEEADGPLLAAARLFLDGVSCLFARGCGAMRDWDEAFGALQRREGLAAENEQGHVEEEEKSEDDPTDNAATSAVMLAREARRLLRRTVAFPSLTDVTFSDCPLLDDAVEAILFAAHCAPNALAEMDPTDPSARAAFNTMTKKEDPAAVRRIELLGFPNRTKRLNKSEVTTAERSGTERLAVRLYGAAYTVDVVWPALVAVLDAMIRKASAASEVADDNGNGSAKEAAGVERANTAHAHRKHVDPLSVPADENAKTPMRPSTSAAANAATTPSQSTVLSPSALRILRRQKTRADRVEIARAVIGDVTSLCGRGGSNNRPRSAAHSTAAAPTPMATTTNDTAAVVGDVGSSSGANGNEGGRCISHSNGVSLAPHCGPAISGLGESPAAPPAATPPALLHQTTAPHGLTNRPAVTFLSADAVGAAASISSAPNGSFVTPLALGPAASGSTLPSSNSNSSNSATAADRFVVRFLAQWALLSTDVGVGAVVRDREAALARGDTASATTAEAENNKCSGDVNAPNANKKKKVPRVVLRFARRLLQEGLEELLDSLAEGDAAAEEAAAEAEEEAEKEKKEKGGGAVGLPQLGSGDGEKSRRQQFPSLLARLEAHRDAIIAQIKEEAEAAKEGNAAEGAAKRLRLPSVFDGFHCAGGGAVFSAPISAASANPAALRSRPVSYASAGAVGGAGATSSSNNLQMAAIGRSPPPAPRRAQFLQFAASVQYTTLLVTPAELIALRCGGFAAAIRQHLRMMRQRAARRRRREAMKGGDGDGGNGGASGDGGSAAPTSASPSSCPTNQQRQPPAVGDRPQGLDAMFEAMIDLRWSVRDLRAHLGTLAHLPATEPIGLVRALQEEEGTAAAPNPLAPFHRIVSEEEHWSLCSVTLSTVQRRAEGMLKRRAARSGTAAPASASSGGAGAAPPPAAAAAVADDYYSLMLSADGADEGFGDDADDDGVSGGGSSFIAATVPDPPMTEAAREVLRAAAAPADGFAAAATTSASTPSGNSHSHSHSFSSCFPPQAASPMSPLATATTVGGGGKGSGSGPTSQISSPPLGKSAAVAEDVRSNATANAANTTSGGGSPASGDGGGGGGDGDSNSNSNSNNAHGGATTTLQPKTVVAGAAVPSSAPATTTAQAPTPQPNRRQTAAPSSQQPSITPSTASSMVATPVSPLPPNAPAGSRSDNPAGHKFPPLAALFPRGAFFLFHVDVELLANAGAVAKCVHLKDMLRSQDAVHSFRVHDGDLFIVAMIV